MEKDSGYSDTLGSLIRITGMGLGVVLALPALLPGIAHGTLFIGRVMGAPDIAQEIGQSIGNTDVCAVKGDGPPGEYGKVLTNSADGKPLSYSLPFAPIAGAKGAASVLAGHLGCFIPAAFTLAGPAGVKAASSAKGLLKEQELPGALVQVVELSTTRGREQAGVASSGG